MFHSLKDDIKAVVARDPAAKSKLEVMFCYSGLHAIWLHRLSHWLWHKNLKFLARLLSQFARFLTGIEIHPGSQLSSGLFIDHGMGVVIGETAEIGQNVTIYQGVTLGGTSLEKIKRHPTIEDDVIIGAGAKILGAITIGRGSRIGANAVVTKSVPANSVVVGVPGQIISKREKQSDFKRDELPDAIGTAVVSLLERVENIENIMQKDHKGPHSPKDGVWQGDDFSI